jgi:hypothetical protein
MAAVFEAPASHEAVHETAHEWEWEHQEGAHQPEAHEWEAGHESHEWEHPEAHEWEGEWEAGHESHEWEHPEGEWEAAHEWEADPFIGKAFKRLKKGLGSLAKRFAPFAIKAFAGMIPGVGAIAGPVLGKIAQQVLKEGESVAGEVEAEAFGGSNGEAEVGNSEVAHEAALTELLAAEAAEAATEAEAMSAIAATLPMTITIMRGGASVRPVVPVLTQATGRLARSLRRSDPRGRQLLRVMPSIERRAIGTLIAAARRGQPITSPLAVRSLAHATRSVLTDPFRVEAAVGRNIALRRRVAPPSPRRALIYQPQRRAPYNPRRIPTRRYW